MIFQETISEFLEWQNARQRICHDELKSGLVNLLDSANRNGACTPALAFEISRRATNAAFSIISLVGAMRSSLSIDAQLYASDIKFEDHELHAIACASARWWFFRFQGNELARRILQNADEMLLLASSLEQPLPPHAKPLNREEAIQALIGTIDRILVQLERLRFSPFEYHKMLQ